MAGDRPDPVHGAAARASVHRALGDPHRLAIVDLLVRGDRTPGELATALDLPSNLVAFHLRELEAVGVVARRRSEGDARRRYVRLAADEVAGVPLRPTDDPAPRPLRVLFVCTANQARSPLAAALWRALTGGAAESAGTRPADAPLPVVAAAAASRGLVLDPEGPRGIDAVAERPDLVVSVCDRAREEGLPALAPSLHWSIPDPVPHGAAAVAEAVRELEARVRRLGLLAPPIDPAVERSVVRTVPSTDHEARGPRGRRSAR